MRIETTDMCAISELDRDRCNAQVRPTSCRDIEAGPATAEFSAVGGDVSFESANVPDEVARATIDTFLKILRFNDPERNVC